MDWMNAEDQMHSIYSTSLFETNLNYLTGAILVFKVPFKHYAVIQLNIRKLENHNIN